MTESRIGSPKKRPAYFLRDIMYSVGIVVRILRIHISYRVQLVIPSSYRSRVGTLL